MPQPLVLPTKPPVVDMSELRIIVMGASGSGKSTFINLVSGTSTLLVSNGLRSIRQEMGASAAFDLDGSRVRLFDTPGLDDTDGDAHTLKLIATFLDVQAKKGIKLHGVIYLHRISDNRLSGVSKRSLRLFRKICGNGMLNHVVIATTMWDEADAEASEREAELKEDDIFFKPYLDGGAQMIRHDNTVDSGRRIISAIFEGHSQPRHFHNTPDRIGIGYTPDVPLDAFIAVMGATGSGKSTFINLASAATSPLVVSNSLDSCTKEVEMTSPFKVGGYNVRLIDTPGFDDTDISDVTILKKISAFLEAQYRKKIVLHGVIYLHRISDNRIGNTSRRSFRLFRKLCGQDTLKNVIIATTMWDKIPFEEGESREKELKDNERFLKPALEDSARMARHDNSSLSATQIIRTILDNHPKPLEIQHELVNRNLDITETQAGLEVNRIFQDLTREYREEIASLKAKMQEAMDKRDLETRKKLEETQRQVAQKLDQFSKELQDLGRRYHEVVQLEIEKYASLMAGKPPASANPSSGTP